MENPVSLLKTSLATLFILASLLAIPVAAQQKKIEELSLTRCWSYGSESPIDVVVRDGLIFVARDAGIVESLSLDGRRIWSTELGGTILSNVAPKYGSVLVVSAASDGTNPQIRSLSTETGIVKWSSPLKPATKYSVLYFEITATVTAPDGSFESFRASSGEPVVTRTVPQNESISGDDLGNVVRTVAGRTVWKYRTGGTISSIIETPDMIVAGSNDNFIYSISRSSGNVRWKHRLGGRVTALRFFGTDLLLVSGSDDRGVEAIELKKGRTAGRVRLPEGESLVKVEPVDDKSFVLLTNASVSRHTTGSCQQ